MQARVDSLQYGLINESSVIDGADRRMEGSRGIFGQYQADTLAGKSSSQGSLMRNSKSCGSGIGNASLKVHVPCN
jgi:hypothetical protein